MVAVLRYFDCLRPQATQDLQFKGQLLKLLFNDRYSAVDLANRDVLAI